MGDDNERLDLIAGDPQIFAEPTVAPRPSRWRQVLQILGVVAVIAAAAVTWWPSSGPPGWRVFHPAPVPAAGMTHELVFDVPPGPLVDADIAPPPADVRPEVGYVFAEPAGTILTRTWASFRTRRTGLPPAPASSGVASVGGVPADVSRVRVRHTVVWGPLDGRSWTVTTNLFDKQQSIEFANNVAIIEGKPALAQSYDLGKMQPMGSIAAFDCVVLLTDLLQGQRGRGAEGPTTATWATLDGPVSLGSIAAPSDAMPMVEFVLGAGSPATVHDQPALAIQSKELGAVVAWLEEGRLIMVQGDATFDRLTALAESVRPATTGEWRVIARADLRDDPTEFGFGDATRLYRGDDAATGTAFAVTASVVFDQLFVCVDSIAGGAISASCDVSQVGPPLLLITEEVNGSRFVVAVVGEGGVEAELRIKLEEGTWTLPLENFSPELSRWAVATLLPEEYGVIELWIGGKIVAAA